MSSLSPAEAAARQVRIAQEELHNVLIEPETIFLPPPNSNIRPDITFRVNGYAGLRSVAAVRTINTSLEVSRAQSVATNRAREERERKQEIRNQIAEEMRRKANLP